MREIHVHQFDGVSTMRVLPLAAGLVVSAARREPRLAQADFAIHVARVEPRRQLERYRDPAVLAFSLYTWNERYSLEVARLARARFPQALIVAGGPSIPRRDDALEPFLAAHPALDVVVLGEGELTFRELALARLDGRPLAEVAGAVVREHDRLRRGPPRERTEDFTDLPSPYLDGTFDQLWSRLGRQVDSAVCETNRGCPFACTFCDWGQAIASPIHELPIDRVAAEFDWIGSRGIPYVYLVDANFGIRPRDVEIVRRLGRVRQARGAPVFCYFHLTKNATERNLRTVETLQEHGVGCHVALSMQDFEPVVLTAIKRDNIKVDRALRLRGLCNERGIPTFNELLLGLPEQTYDSFARSVMSALTPWPGDTFFLYLARLLINAELAEPAYRARHGIESRTVEALPAHPLEYQPHVAETEEIVVATASMPVADWVRAYRFGYLVAASHNLRLLDVVALYLRENAGAELRGWFEALLDAMASAAPGTVLARMDEVLRTFAQAVLDGHRTVLAIAETGDARREVAEALATVALARSAEWLAEVREVTERWMPPMADPELIAELFAFQALRSPGFGAAATPRVAFTRDWLAWSAGGPNPELRQAQLALRVVPAAWTGTPDLREYVTAWLAAAYQKRPAATLVREPT